MYRYTNVRTLTINFQIVGPLSNKLLKTVKRKTTHTNVHEIAYGFGSPSEKKISRQFSIAKYQSSVSPKLPKFCWSDWTEKFHEF
jgi:hypothetical protein